MSANLKTMLRINRLDTINVIRTVLAYLVVITFIGSVFTGVIYVYYEFLPNQPFYSVVLLLSSIALLLALVARPIRLATQRRLDQLFYGGAHHYREALLNFASNIGNIVNLDELANEMLPTISRALLVTQTRLLVADEQGDFTAQFGYPELEGESNHRLHFGTDSPIVVWLEKENTPLNVGSTDGIRKLEGLPSSEREGMIAGTVDVLCPIKSRGRLIGILTLGAKQSALSYTYQDMKTIMVVTGQVGPMIENAQLYSQAVSLATTDGLTALYNHRHFHRLLEQEIARCSRYGTAFSLIILDIDFFKVYNDTFGHLTGDGVLREVGELIRESIRTLDTAFRYGGEEFAIILPETPPKSAYVVAERIRERLEEKTSSEAMTVTASFGIASWPTDSVTKEEIIGRADAALYHAKRTGRNRTCLSSELAKTELPTSVELENEAITTSTVYALAAAIDAKDHYTYGHSRKVSDLAMAIAEALGLSPHKIAVIRAAGLLHDVGKIGIPDSILTKDGALTCEEWQVTRLHPKRGIEIIKQVVELKDCLPAILHHHERWDGKGYPFSLEGDNIPLEARILTVADSYDALTSERHYRERLSPEDALHELKYCAGTQFDPNLVDIFSRSILVNSIL
ncbi:diguanylate cyclase [Chloroflexota bacterium]